MTSWTISLVGLCVCLWPCLAVAECKSTSAEPRALVQEKTPVRRGPGLNFGPSSILDKPRCLRLSEVAPGSAWVLVEDDKKKVYGWVPVSALDKEGRARALAMAPKNEVTRRKLGEGSSPARDNDPAKPNDTATRAHDKEGASQSKHSGEKRVKVPTPEAAPVEPSSREASTTEMSKARAGDKPPVASGDEQTEVAAVSVRTATRAQGLIEGVALQVDVGLLGAISKSSFDNDGQPLITRYEIRNRSGGLRLDVRAGPLLERFEARLIYNFVYSSGLKLKDGDDSISGQEHDLEVLAGMPIELGSLRVTPAVGYAMSLHAMEPGLPGAKVAQFVSSVTHAARIGASGGFAIDARLSLEADVALVLGSTVPQYGLGSPGVSAGFRSGLAGRYGLTERLSCVVRWDLRYFHAPYDGMAEFERSITKASLSGFENALSFGVGLAL